MNIGLLYSDSNKETPFIDKVEAAVESYKKRYPFPPMECHVNSKTAENINISKVNGIKIVIDDQIREHDFWIGSKEQNYERS